MFLLFSCGFSLHYIQLTPLLPSVFLIIESDINWSERDMQFLRSSSAVCCNFLDEISLCSWSNSAWLATPGQICHGFLHLEMMAFMVIHCIPRALESALCPFPDQYIPVMFFLRSSGSSSDWGMVCCLFRPFIWLHIAAVVLFKWCVGSSGLAAIKLGFV